MARKLVIKVTAGKDEPERCNQAFTVASTVPTGRSPTSMAVKTDGSQGYVSDLDDGTLTVLNLAG